MPIESAPEPNEEEKEETIVARILSQQQGKDDFARSWVMEEQRIIKQRDVGSWVNQANLDRLGRTQFHKDLEAARLAVSGNQTAARLCIGRDRYCYVSFTLVDPEVVSYLNLDCPDGQGFDTAYPFVRATDEDLVLFDIYAPRLVPDRGAPPELFVYTAAGPSPSVQRLPVYAKDNDRREVRGFLKGKFTTGILRLSEKRYIVADLSVLDGALCVFNSSKTKEWEIIPITPGLVHWHPPEQNQSRSGQLPNQWSTDDVLAFDGRFLCWVDYFSGVLLRDFTIGSPALHFVPFPGEKEYPAEVRVPRQFPGRFRSVSSSRGKMCFVHIDNDFHETIQDDWPCRQLPERTSQGQQHQVPPKITIWTLNPDEFKWEQGAVINLDLLWAQPRYKNFPQRLPEFPIFHAPDLLICLLREKEFDGMGFMIMVDMMHANLQSWTPYINRQFCCAECKYAVCGECVDDRKEFPNMLLLPTVFSRYIPKIYRYDIVERQGCSSSLKEA